MRYDESMWMHPLVALSFLACFACDDGAGSGSRPVAPDAASLDMRPTDATVADVGATDAAALDAAPVDATPVDGTAPDFGPDAAVACAPWPGAAWNQPVADAPLDPQSDAMLAWLQDQGGFGLGRVQTDFSIEVMEVAPGDPAPLRPFTPTGDHFSPDCDVDPIPVPPGGAIEGNPSYACESDGDCHLIVMHHESGLLYEMWRADIRGDQFNGGCLSVWDIYAPYGPEGRGTDCTSADAAGLPIAPLLFTADEVAAGSIDHAIRFILPNDRIRERLYVSPATHSTPATGGGPLAIPYGGRLRLRADYPVDTLPTEGARVVARALQTYGMILADAGRVALTARSDRFTTAKWDGLLGSRDLDDLQVADFEVVALPPTELWDDCVRAPRPPRACDP